MYKYFLYLLCDALRLKKTRHDDDVTFPQLRRAIIQWWYLHCYLNFVKHDIDKAWKHFDFYYKALLNDNLAYDLVELYLIHVKAYLVEQHKKVKNDD